MSHPKSRSKRSKHNKLQQKSKFFIDKTVESVNELAVQENQNELASPQEQLSEIYDTIVPYDESLLERARTQWQFGEWESLTKLELDKLQHHPDRAKLVLLAASAHFQANNVTTAKQLICMAQSWGCDKKVISQILVAGVHNTLGRAAAIINDEKRVVEHFQSAVKGVYGGTSNARQTRIFRELAHLALLPEFTSALLNKQKNGVTVRSSSSENDPVNPMESYTPFATILRPDFLESKYMQSKIETGNGNSAIFREGIISYAQNFEDVMLWRALGHVKDGFYIDVGAQDPIVDSVSKAFYEHDWRGIHVEAIPYYVELLRQDRPDEIVLQVALSDISGISVFYEIPDTGISTGDPTIARGHQEKGFTVNEITVSCITLAEVFAKTGTRDIHWLKIDVEGMERQVLNSWEKSNTRPWIVVVESTLPLTQIETRDQWEYLLLMRGYQIVYFDGLNRYYVSEHHHELVKAFRVGPNIFDNFMLNGTSSSIFCALINAKLKQKEQEIIGLQKSLEAQQTKNNDMKE